jgi:PAS domain S-box-containing protein
MSDKPIHLLLIEDNPGDARLIREFLSETRSNPYLLECADQLSKGLELLTVRDVDLVLLDLSLPDSQGFDTFARVYALVPDLPIVVVTGSDDEMLAVRAVHAGAQDYLVKGEIDSGLLSRAMRYAIERKKTETALRKAREELEVRVEKRTADLAKANKELRSEISERRLAEEALRREHSFRTAIIERAAEGLCVCHEVSEHPFVEFTVWNERMTEITGYTMDDINRVGWYQSVQSDPEVQARAIDCMARLRRGEDLIAEEWEIVRADMEMRTVRISTSILQGADGLPHVLALMDDITAQKKAEAALKRSHGYLEKLVAERTIELRKTNDLLMLETSERRRANQELTKAHQQLQDIINFLPDATFVIDRQKRVIAWNRAIEEMTGIKQQEIIGKGDYAYAVPFYGERRTIIIDLVMGGENEADKKYDFVERKEKTVYGEVFVPKTYKGRGAYLWGTASPLFDQGGNVIGAIQSIRDISDRKQAEEALKQSEEKYRQLFETVADAIVVFDWETRRFIDVNEKACCLYGYSREEFLELTHTDITAEPDSSNASLEETLAGTRTMVPLRYHKKKEGTLFPAEISSNTFDLAGRRVLCGVVRDITERMQAEEAITQQHNFQQTLIDTIPSPVFYKDTEGRYLGCNSSFESYIGLRKADIIGKTVYEIAPRDLADIYRQADLAMFQDPGVQRYEACVQYADGTRHDVLFTKGTFTDLAGKTAGLVGVMLDITERKLVERELSEYRDRLEDLVRERTGELEQSNERLMLEIKERKQAEEALRESRQMLHLVLDTIPVRVFWKDVDSNYLGCNRPFALDAGLQSPEEIVGRNDFEMSWAEQAQLYISDDRMVIETGRPKLGYEEPQTTPSGDKIWLRTSKISLSDLKGRIKGVLGIYEDITAHKQAEEALQKAHDELERRVEERTAELEKANEDLRQVPSKLISAQEEERKRLSSELHDSIGQTLAAVKFWVEMSLKLRDEGDGNAALNHLEQFVPILQRSIEETRSIYMGLRPSMLDKMGVLATLEWLRRECMKFYPERHIELEAGIAEEEIPETLKINIFRIAQEALNNIAKHSRAEWVDISLSKKADSIELAVSDDGVGMDLELILRTSTAMSLGLTSMRERAELTGGSFGIESTPGEGTTVRASWPFKVKGQLDPLR